MAKKITLFECQHCGAQSSKWLGKCSNCDSWESFVELKASEIESLKNPSLQGKKSSATPITEVAYESVEKFTSTQEEFDIVLGGGIVKGGLYLIGGSPGVGKSTLLLKVSGGLAQMGKNVLYVSGEESAGQIRMRADRLSCVHENLFLLNEIELSAIKTQLVSKKYEICIIDSIQTIFSSQILSAPGSVSQVREITFELMRLAKEYEIAIFIIGHITKEGNIAGPRVLEHMVDCVLYFEGDPSRELRLLRGFKNRFGATSDVGIFEMKNDGLVSAKNASRLFFSAKSKAAGSAITILLEGSRALVLEIQALVSESSFATPKRSATGFDTNRLNMLLALLEKKLEIPLNRYDVFINVTGGIKITETSADLAVIASILSSFKNRPLNHDVAFIGEVSLIGDIREVSNMDMRLKEMENYGFKNAILAKRPKTKTAIKCFEVAEVTKILDWM
ncbi:DNA repair protein RadA [Helicobacter mustelae]|uniref:DNA repair protein RadA n=1 Tax=Helicobacter mustelae (strain ATCC 43772 / CCUG 25715 / CIP 103759 / LMG 18044 / NCTC 12198 / R85-136P) TaxID=679897 RepID=D3UJA8_HELM1|nr:DNA repair protein RadA [Helicobacter mustelae]CBG40583.1 putative DNA repair protein RadA (ATP-dependant protease) [Helicobacter mustelae 12198]SQH72080.1 DNA repair protein RadA [Helicobacter mustelae]STP13224.1 DNA repair protein RadA [Helicobacter mustelae]